MVPSEPKPESETSFYPVPRFHAMASPPAHDPELLKVITDFLEQGHADSIAAMFRQDPGLYGLVGLLLEDERYVVRMGVSVLFEELVECRPREVELAIPALTPLLDDGRAWVRGEAVSILGIINTPAALALLPPLAQDPDPQIREIVADFLSSS